MPSAVSHVGDDRRYRDIHRRKRVHTFRSLIAQLVRSPCRPRVMVESVEPRLLFATFVVSNMFDSGPGSLRQAMLDANNFAGADQISFNIAGDGLKTISPTSALPAITEAVSLDATTQPGFFINQIPVIQLNGISAGAGAAGIVIATDNVTVQGFTINRFAGNGISVQGDNAFIALNNVGTSPTATDPTLSERPGVSNLGNGANGIMIQGDNCLVVNCVIAYNRLAGTAVISGVRNDIGLNSYYGNGKLGIDLGGDGVTANDPGDVDSGPNDLLNSPVLTSVEVGGDNTFVFGTIHSVPNRAISITIYSSPSDDGQGFTVLTPSNIDVVTNESGDASFGEGFPISKARGFLTAVATSSASEQDEFPDVSEFSAPRAVPGTVPPKVTGVFFNGQSWSPAFRAGLVSISGGDPALGYRLPNSDNPVFEIPWTGVDQISMQFDRDVNFDRSTFRLAGVNTPIYGISRIVYNASTHVVTYTLSSPVNFADRLAIVSTGIVSVADGTTFDGDGDGFPGGTFRKPVFALPGDQDLSRNAVNATDVVLTRNRIGRSLASPGSGLSAYTLFADIDGSSVIDASDLVLVRNRVGSKVPPAPATLFASRRIAPLVRSVSLLEEPTSEDRALLDT